jgi:dCMP deaminase
MFMEMAEILAKRSTCLRNNVGALLVNEKHNIVSCGYNGPAPGCEHCTATTCLGKGCNRSQHAEHNAIAKSTEKKGCFYLYTTVSPCIKCVEEIIKFKNIKKVFYRYPYRDLTSLESLRKANIQIYRVLSSGEIIDESISTDR